MHIDPLSPRFAPIARPSQPPPAAPARGAAGPDFKALLSDRAELSPGVPATPPPEVMEAVDTAARVFDELHASGRELRFSQEGDRLVIEVRDLEGKVLRRIPPTEALAVASAELRA